MSEQDRFGQYIGGFGFGFGPPAADHIPNPNSLFSVSHSSSPAFGASSSSSLFGASPAFGSHPPAINTYTRPEAVPSSNFSLSGNSPAFSTLTYSTKPSSGASQNQMPPTSISHYLSPAFGSSPPAINTYTRPEAVPSSNFSLFAVSTPIPLTSSTKPSSTSNETPFRFGPSSQSHGKEEVTVADSQHENIVPVEIKHEKVVKKKSKCYPILNSPLPVILISRILKGIPQSPHFLQLRCYSETARTNLEAAWDRTFEETVELIHELRVSDFWAMAGKLWKTMEELHSLGYNVFVLRKRVVELSGVMVKQNKRQNEIMVLKVRAELHRMEKSRLESAIRNLRAEAQGEQDKMVETLIEAADLEKDLPQLENELVNLAIVPLKF